MSAVAIRTPEAWKRHIVRQLKNRDQNQNDVFQDLIRLYCRLLERTSLAKVLLGPERRPSAERYHDDKLEQTTGELAYQVVELQRQVRMKNREVDEQRSRLKEVELQLAVAADARRDLQVRVSHTEGQNRTLRDSYDVLLQRRQEMEESLRDQEVKHFHLVEDMIRLKQQAAAHLNSRNARKSSSLSAPSSRSTSPKDSESTETRPRSLFRSASVSSPRIFKSIKDMFETKRRGQSVSSVDDFLFRPERLGGTARVPARALSVLEAHEQGINAVKFSYSSDLLATGGTDRVVKLWDVRAGSLCHRGTLEGSTEGITSVEFDTTDTRILAASYNKSAMLWQLDNSVAKLTLTGHSKKVTAAKFSFRHVVTGSSDRTIRLWDLRRAACVQVVNVTSSCTDLVCSGAFIISGHYDARIRVWDSRVSSCVQELPAQGKVTSLDISSDQRQLLCCCRGDSLQVLDLRWPGSRICFRADGFKCANDSTKAVFSPDGCFLGAGSADGAVYIWNVSSNSLVTKLPDKHRSAVSAVDWCLSGNYVVSVDRSRWAVLWCDI